MARSRGRDFTARDYTLQLVYRAPRSFYLNLERLVFGVRGRSHSYVHLDVLCVNSVCVDCVVCALHRRLQQRAADATAEARASQRDACAGVRIAAVVAHSSRLHGARWNELVVANH